tara:strand:+ start:252 stop:488 length:237 start_codon:yes stop_codon:yes gene_type:complete
MKTKKYQITITVATIQRPKDIVWFVTRKLKDVMNTLGIDIKEVEDRPTNDEHHGGVTDGEESLQDKVQQAYDKIPERY